MTRPVAGKHLGRQFDRIYNNMGWEWEVCAPSGTECKAEGSL